MKILTLLNLHKVHSIDNFKVFVVSTLNGGIYPVSMFLSGLATFLFIYLLLF